MPHRQHPKMTTNARELRARQTKAESLLWQLIRGRRLCGLKFRRQLPIDQHIADFACVEHRLIVELDGDYHDFTYEQDRVRQDYLEALGWRVIRFANEDVLANVEAVGVAIARELGMEAEN